MKNSLLALLGLVASAVVTPVALATETGTPAAQAATAESVVAAVEKKYAGVSTIKADFEQTVKSAVFGDDTQKGHVVLKRPSKMKWEFDDEGKQFVTDGKTMWIYTKADNQVIRYDDISGNRTALDSMLSSLDKLDELFQVTLAEQDAEKFVLDLVPSDTEQIKKVRLTLTNDYLLKKVVITDPFDSVTELAFAGVDLTSEVPDSAFDFVPPAGAEVIEAGQF